jgi:micrococcal nuclease
MFARPSVEDSCVRLSLSLALLLICSTCTARTVERSPSKEGTWSGKVIGVSDGDTITILKDRTPIKVRLMGVDAPEKDQPFGTQAKKFTSEQVFGKEVSVRIVTQDIYGRQVAWIYLGARCLNEELLQAGLAWHYSHYDKSEKLAKLEQAARAAKRGLWAEANATPPWSWRKAAKRRSPIADSSSTGLLQGNTKNKVFHQPGCKSYDCKHCTATFSTVKAALAAGYRPCGQCKPDKPSEQKNN